MHVSAAGDDEPNPLRDQFRQLLRYRWLIGGGVGIGLVGGAWLGVTSAESYAASSDVRLRAPSTDPFNSAVSVDKSVDMGSERQTAISGSVLDLAASRLGVAGGAGALRSGIQVTNPPQTMVLHFTYTAASPTEAARRANALTKAYLDLRKKQWTGIRDSMVKNYTDELNPLGKQQDELTKEINELPEDTAASDSAYTVRANLLNKINDLQSSISSLKSLNMTPGDVIAVATAPASSQGLGLPLSVGLGGAVGVALGLLGAWVRLVFDPSPRSSSDIVRAVRAPVLGTLPRAGSGPLLADQADSRIAEEYRSVAFRLAYDQRFADRRRLLVVAPRGSSDAAAAVAANLAASFAETGKDVLLIEADLRTPSLAGRLRVNAAARPSWSLPADPDEAGWPGSRQLSVDAGESGSFDLVPGERVRNVARALTSTRMTRLIDEADSPNATVVVLAPPVLAYADALALADRVDGVLVVCDPTSVHRADLARIRELITGAGGTVLGAVVHTKPHRRPGKGGSSAHRGARGAGNGPPPPAGPAQEPEQPPMGDGSDTVGLRTVRAGDLR
ncbi:lipopolysaccharide biosynthesis protein [Streptomyces sp. NBC_00370]|uniref:lipopolysaccharide biosynthesis protein n=1 Tax=Streptomyces sp. NBC_00370 TaxID=2975728 RepID=UPI002E254042